MESSIKQKKHDLSCELCNNLFNLNAREPIRLLCCGLTACKECVQRDMIKSDDKTIIKKG